MSSALQLRSISGGTIYPLHSEKIVIGRDPSCDIIVGDSEVSRQHAVLHVRFGRIYVESVSLTAPLLINDRESEYFELNINDRIQVGSHIFIVEALKQQVTAPSPTTSQEAPASGFDAINDLSDPRADGNHSGQPVSVNKNLGQEGINIADSFQSAPHTPPSGPLSEFEFGEDQSQDIPPPAIPSQDLFGAFPPKHDSSQSGSATAMIELVELRLIVLRGGTPMQGSGQEVVLKNGDSWVFGSDPGCDIPFVNSTLPARHFQILRNGNRFALQTLDSTVAVLINGVKTQAQLLEPFDKIVAGPLELKVTLNQVGTPPRLAAPVSNDFSPGLGADDGSPTQVYVPQVYVPPQNEYIDSSIPHISASAVGTKPSAKVGWTEQKKAQLSRASFALGIAIIAMGVYYYLDQQSQQRGPASQISAPLLKSAAPQLLSEETSEGAITEAFRALNETEKNRIRSLYSEALKAKAESTWPLVQSNTKEILDKVGNYRDSAQLLSEANEKLSADFENELKLARSAKPPEEEAAELIELGKAKLQDKQWVEAEDLCSKAYNLTANPEAYECLLNAQSKGLRQAQAAPEPIVERKPSSDDGEDVQKAKAEAEAELRAQARARERQAIQALRMQLQDAQSQMEQGKFGPALSNLAQLQMVVHRKQAEFRSGIQRSPSAVSGDGASSNEIRKLQELELDVSSAMASIATQLESTYSTQLIDAEQFMMNRQFDKARLVYDQILNEVPDFEKVQQLRGELYQKIVVDARQRYQDSLIYESIGRTQPAIDGYRYTLELLAGVDDFVAKQYYEKAKTKLEQLTQ